MIKQMISGVASFITDLKMNHHILHVITYAKVLKPYQSLDDACMGRYKQNERSIPCRVT